MSELKIAAAYIRVSDYRQEEYSPISQLKLIRDYAKQHGYILPDEFIFQDDGISAKTAAKRPQFNAMIAHAKDKSHPFDAILVWKFSRFARNQEESIVYKSLLKKNNVEVISISEPVTEGPFGGLIERIIEFFDEFYLIRLSGEVKRGMTEKVSRGEPICAPAFGYDIKEKHYYPNADAPIVREVFESYAGGEGMRHIAQRLAGRGVRTRFGNPPDNRWIEYMLHNPVYIGKIRWCTDGRAASRRDYDNPKMLTVDGKHEAIVDLQLFDTVQAMMAETKRRYGKFQRSEQPADFMLKGLLRCSSCGATLVRSVRKKGAPPDRFSLQCHNYARGTCHTSHSITVQSANAGVINALEECIRTDDFNITVKSASHDGAASDYNGLISDAERKLSRVRAAYENGVDTLEEYTRSKRAILAEIESYRREQAAEAARAVNIDRDAFRSRIQEVLNFIKDDSNTEKSKNEMLRSIIDKIIYNKASGALSVFFYF